MNEPTMTVAEYLAAHPPQLDKPFKPRAWYIEAGDMIECFLTADRCYAEVLTPGIDVFRSQATGEIVGVQIHGVRRMVAPHLVKPPEK